MAYRLRVMKTTDKKFIGTEVVASALTPESIRAASGGIFNVQEVRDFGNGTVRARNSHYCVIAAMTEE